MANSRVVFVGTQLLGLDSRIQIQRSFYKAIPEAVCPVFLVVTFADKSTREATSYVNERNVILIQRVEWRKTILKQFQ
ncbi:hypothetical protein LXL04_001230 [Taraxacum kok-saghyz]